MGSLSVKWRNISNDAEPAPITTPALNSMVGTPDDRNISPVIARADMCGESSSSGDAIPPK